ncbi:MAG: hypothetical protein M5U19_07490 [Microthrixaceae bacterium]|nr:hypothetical protein [Microthrixaceae bacterium]
MPRTIGEWSDAVAGDDPPPERIKRWARSYLGWAASPEHQLVAPLIESLGALDDVTRTEVTELHRSMMDVVAGVVAEADIPEDQVQGTVDLLAGLVLGVARAEARGGRADAAVRRRLDAAIEAVLAAP